MIIVTWLLGGVEVVEVVLSGCKLLTTFDPSTTLGLLADLLVDRALQAANTTTDHRALDVLPIYVPLPSLPSAHVPAFAVVIAVAVLLAPTLLARFPSLDT